MQNGARGADYFRCSSLMKTAVAIAALITAVIALQVASAVAIYSFLPDWGTRGQFGDLFGAVSALFSGLAFAVLIYTVHLQGKELQLQRVELSLTRTELARSAQAQEKSERALLSQALAAQTAAEIAAINNLLTFIHSEINRLSSDPTGAIVYREELDKLRTQRANLIRNLNKLYSESVAARTGAREVH